MKIICRSVLFLLCVCILVIGGFYDSISTDSTRLLSIFLKIGLGPEFRFIKKGHLIPPLHFANSIEAIQLLTEYGVHINEKDRKYGLSPLHIASYRKNLEVVRFLTENKGDINAKDALGRTPLFFSLGDESLELLESMIKIGANINVKDYEGNTLLHEAVNQKKLKTVSFLIKNKANPNIKDNQGRTPLDIAKMKKYENIVKILKTASQKEQEQ